MRLSVYRGPDSGFQDLDGQTDRRTDEQDLSIIHVRFRTDEQTEKTSLSFTSFSGGCPRLIPGFFLFVFFFSPFSGGFAVYGRTDLYVFLNGVAQD